MEYKSILGFSHWVQLYLCGFPWMTTCYWPLAYLFDGWLYDTILVWSVTEGSGQGMWPFSGYDLSGKDVSGWEFNKSLRSCWALCFHGWTEESRMFHQHRALSSKISSFPRIYFSPKHLPSWNQITARSTKISYWFSNMGARGLWHVFGEPLSPSDVPVLKHYMHLILCPWYNMACVF